MSGQRRQLYVSREDRVIVLNPEWEQMGVFKMGGTGALVIIIVPTLEKDCAIK